MSAGSPTLTPTTPAQSAPTSDPTAPSQTLANGTAFTASCPADASTTAAGCGSWDAGPSSGQAPGFAAGQQSSQNFLEVNQDGWSGSQGPQVLTASSFQDWSVTATDTDPSNSPGQVLTYPDASYNYYQLGSPEPSAYDLNHITSLTSDYTEQMPPASESYLAEAAYDIWLNDFNIEVMVWVDNHQGDNVFANSGDTQVGTYTLGGQSFTLWTNGSGFFIFSLNGGNQSSGTVDLKAILEQLVTLKDVPADSSITEIPFGWEVSSTYGKPMTFSMSRFDVNLQG